MKIAIGNWYLLFIAGSIFVALGGWALITPLKSYFEFVLIFSISFMAAGFLEVAFALSNTKDFGDWLWPFVYGLVNFLIGLLLIANPEVSIFTLPVYIGFKLLFRSVITIGISLNFHKPRLSGLDRWVGISTIGMIFSLILLWNPNFAGLSLVVWRSIALITIGLYSICFSFKIKRLYIIVENVFKT